MAAMPSVSTLIDLLQPHATANWAVPALPSRDQPAHAANAPPAPGQLPGQSPVDLLAQSQLQTLALVLNQAPSQMIMNAAPRTSAGNPAVGGAPESKANARATRKTAATRQFQLARKLYGRTPSGETDDASPQFSFMG